MIGSRPSPLPPCACLSNPSSPSENSPDIDISSVRRHIAQVATIRSSHSHHISCYLSSLGALGCLVCTFVSSFPRACHVWRKLRRPPVRPRPSLAPTFLLSKVGLGRKAARIRQDETRSDVHVFICLYLLVIGFEGSDEVVDVFVALSPNRIFLFVNLMCALS